MSLIGEERKEIILHLLNYAGKVRTNELVEKLQVSSETIRRYLEELEHRQKLKRVYGGAIKINYDREEPSHFKREVLHAEEKKRIARTAASLVQNNDVIVLDDGTTTLHMIGYLENKKNLTVITNSVPALSLFVDYCNKGSLSGDIFFLGGRIQSKHSRTSGLLSEKMFEHFHVDKSFISIDGIVLQQGITSYDSDKALLARKFIEQSNETIVMSDHSKIGMSNFYKIADIKEVDIIVSDTAIPSDWEAELEMADIKWIVAS